jgi:hypothetical protein
VPRNPNLPGRSLALLEGRSMINHNGRSHNRASVAVVPQRVKGLRGRAAFDDWREYCKPERWHPAATVFPLISSEELAELAADIKTNGLLEPVELLDGLVIDGRSRLLACQLLADRGVQVMPAFVVMRGASPYEYVWSKNAVRRHLNPSQKAAIAALILREGESASANLHSGDAARQVAEVTGAGRRNVFYAQRVLDYDPSLFQRVREGEIKIKAAVEIVDRRERIERLQQERRGRAPSVDSNFICGRAQDHIACLPDGSVRLLLTDPPYGINYKSLSPDPELQRPLVGDRPEEAPQLLRDVLSLLEPKLANDAHCYIFSAANGLGEFIPIVHQFFEDIQVLCLERLLPRPTLGRYPLTHEHVIFGMRGHAPRPLLGWRKGTRFTAPRIVTLGPTERGMVDREWPPPRQVRERPKIHPTQKPPEWLWRFILESSYRDELVVDPFAGSGSTLWEAKRLGRAFWGTEIDPVYHRQGRAYLAHVRRLSLPLKILVELLLVPEVYEDQEMQEVTREALAKAREEIQRKRAAGETESDNLWEPFLE